MKRLTYWSSKHINLARLVLTISYLLLAALSVILGLIWAYSGAFFPGYLLFYFILLGLTIGIIKYPARKVIREEIRYGTSYLRKWKIYDLLLVFSMFLMALSFGYEIPSKDASAYPAYYLTGQILDFDPGLKVLDHEKRSSTLKERFFKRVNQINQRIKSESFKIFKRIEEKSANGWFWVIIILGSLAILFLQYFLVVIACSLSCNGNVAGAFIVFFGGSAVLFYVFFRIIREFFKRKALKDETPSDKKSLNRKAGRIVGILALMEGIFMLILSATSS